jgi:hypothetical protein
VVDDVTDERVFAVLIGLLTPKLMEISVAYVYSQLMHWLLLIEYTGNRATFLTFSTCTFFGYLFSTYLVPETAGVSLEEIDAVFGTSVGREDVELRRQVCTLYLVREGLNANFKYLD